MLSIGYGSGMDAASIVCGHIAGQRARAGKESSLAVVRFDDSSDSRPDRPRGWIPRLREWLRERLATPEGTDPDDRRDEPFGVPFLV